MNLEDVLDPEYGLQQDEWSLSKPTFGEEGQLEVVGWSGKLFTGKLYLLRCNKCSRDTELFGEGCFKSVKPHLKSGCIPCGCSKRPLWTKEQFKVLCSRKANKLGYTFLSFVGEWKGSKTKIKILCEKHGEWDTGNINTLTSLSCGCPDCKRDVISKVSKKRDDLMVASFFASGYFHSDTKFWRSERQTIQGYKCYWFMSCPECGEIGETTSNNLQQGQRSCACNNQRQQECYINWVVNEYNNAVAIKFGIARDSKQRIKSQDRQSAYEVRQYQVYSFPSVASCKQAERECKKELETGVVLKRDMPDGWTETTWSYNIGKVIDIYKRNGGVLV